MQQAFKFDWFKCRDGYRIEKLSRAQLLNYTSLTKPKRIVEWWCLVPKSTNWETFKPLDIPAAYRAFSKWDGTDEGLRDLADAYGSMRVPKARAEQVDAVRNYVSGLCTLVACIDRGEWQVIADGLNSSGGETRVGRLGVVFEVIDNKPKFRLKPLSLVDALQAQALFDAAFGIEHKKCRSPECDQWFPTKGPDAYRSDAEYHSEACRRRHAYLISKKKER